MSGHGYTPEYKEEAVKQVIDRGYVERRIPTDLI